MAGVPAGEYIIMRALTLALLASLHFAVVYAHAAPREKKEPALAATLEEVPKQTRKLLKAVCKTAIELDGEFYANGIRGKERGFQAQSAREYRSKTWEMDKKANQLTPQGEPAQSPWELKEVPTWIHIGTGRWYRTKADILVDSVRRSAEEQGLKGKAIAFGVVETHPGWIAATDYATGKFIRIDLAADSPKYKAGDNDALLLKQGKTFAYRTSKGVSVGVRRYEQVPGTLPTMSDFQTPEVEPLFLYMAEHKVDSISRYKPTIKRTGEPQYEMIRKQRGVIVVEKKGDLKRKGTIVFAWEERRPLRFDFKARKRKN